MTYAQETVVGRSLILIKYGALSDLVLGWGLLIYWNKRKMKNMTMVAQINFKLFVDTKFRVRFISTILCKLDTYG